MNDKSNKRFIADLQMCARRVMIGKKKLNIKDSKSYCNSTAIYATDWIIPTQVYPESLRWRNQLWRYLL